MRPAQKWTVFRKNGTCFSFSYTCLSFYFIPIFIPSTLRNKPKQLFNSKDFFTVRWYDGVRCQLRDPRGRCQSPELGSSCQGPTLGGETSRAQDGYPEPERHGPLTPAARLVSYQRPGTLGHSALPRLTCSMVIGGHSPQGQPAQAPQSPLGVLGGLWSSEKSPWQGGVGTSG